MKNRDLEAELLNDMNTNNCEPYYDQWFKLDGLWHPFSPRNYDEVGWYRGYEGDLDEGDPWVLFHYWRESGGRLFTFISHPEFIVVITHHIVMLLFIKKEKGQ